MTAGDLLAVDDRRIEGAAKVTGAAPFAADLRREGMLHAAFVASPHPHARVLAVDSAAARAMPGVRAILTGADVRPAHLGRRLQDWPVLAWDRVRFVGDRVAAVAADTLAEAEAAARAIDVSYEELPAVFEPEAALRDGAPILHPDVATYRVLGKDPRPPLDHPNLQGRMRHEHGDVDAAFASAHRVFEDVYHLPRIHFGYLEPRAALVWWEGPGLHVVSTSKDPFGLREQLAATLGLAAAAVDVATVNVGGDFGGKGFCFEEFALAFLARATGRPVRSVMRYSDELAATTARRAATIRMRTGVDSDGLIVAHEARIVWDCGAYAGSAPGVASIPGQSLGVLSGYRVPAARLEAIGCYTNSIPGGSMRAPGQPQLEFAGESHLDDIARSLGRDPLGFREANLARPGDRDARGAESHGSTLPAVLATLRREARWGAPLAAGHGRGVAIGLRHQGRGRATAALTLHPDGSVEALTGAIEHGTGSHTVIQRVIACELGLDLARVRVVHGSTAELPAADPGMGGSKSTVVHGGAALAAAQRLAAEVAQLAPGLPLAEAARRVGPLRVTGSVDESRHRDGASAQVVEVAVDAETGAVRIVDAVVVLDVGTVISPVALRGQLEGGFVMGLGQALTEEAVLEDGRLVNASLGDYKLPAITEVPPLRVVLYTDEPGNGPFGAGSAGEMVNPFVPAAIANAIADAVGARVRTLPLTAERVRAALRTGSPV